MQGAIRETWEEALAEVDIIAPFVQLDIPLIAQVYILFRARLKNPTEIGCGPESLDVKLVPLDELKLFKVRYDELYMCECEKRQGEREREGEES